MPSARALLTLLLFIASLAAGHARAGEPVGMRPLEVPSPARGARLDGSLWYPAGPGGTPGEAGGTPVFRATPARLGAPLAEGRFPLVLVSHGGLRSAPHMADWLARGLAAEGMIVAVIRPPAPASAEAALAEIWLRPDDLRTALDSLLADPALAPHVDESRIGAVGLFLGGTSVLALAGARLDPEGLRGACDTPGRAMDCGWFAAQGLDLHAAELGPLAKVTPEPRLRAGVLVDPEFAALMTPESLRGISLPLTAISLGTAESRPPALDATPLLGRLPGLDTVTLPEAGRFDAFALCTPRGAAILAEEEPDAPLCASHGRAAHHRMLLAEVLAGLRRGLGS
ncbi:hypothetical protein [Oceanicella sp. SM1341]|uniref:alpha/beta hydrolase family protein n=1 Tax=Oceanicella sp. SM1341 TaxID=1548889 RepID=UPI000E54C0C9|nr:hypothetical protein [Oceanicella sp. SM1341]